jgi:20S proteasome alpha/beta subunit
MADSRYNYSLTTFGKTGRLGQIDHALKAVENGNTSLGIKGEFPERTPLDSADCAPTRAAPPLAMRAAKNGAVLATKKMLPTSLVDEDSIQHIVSVADHIGEGLPRVCAGAPGPTHGCFRDGVFWDGC